MTATATTPLLDKTKLILEMIKKGKFVEGMEEFYADDAVNEEPTGATIEGKTAIIEHEKNILRQVAAFHGVEVKSIAVAEDDGNGNGVTMAEYRMQDEMKDGSRFNPDQVQVTRWKNGQAVHIKFYYNPNF